MTAFALSTVAAIVLVVGLTAAVAYALKILSRWTRRFL